ncbi:MAG: site-2 protease family protein [Planctomycetota bacterium]
MLPEILVDATLLAATDEPGWLTSFLGSSWLWVKVALGIGLVVFVHELGHFVAAKTFGVKCEKFYVGFDVPIQIGPIKFPRALGRVTYGETEYGIGILPLGGYVKMLGQDDDPRKAEAEAQRIRQSGDGDSDEPELDPRSYPAKPVWQRMIIISAGVVMNVITGVLFAAIAYFAGVTYTPATVGMASAGGPAWEAGIRPGGRIVSVADAEDDPQLHFQSMTMDIMTAGLDDATAPINVRVDYGNERSEYRLKTRPSPAQPERRMIGIASPLSNRLPQKYYAMPKSAAADTLTGDDAGATIVAIDGAPLDENADVQAAPILGAIQSNPTKEISLTLVRADDSKHAVTLPPQLAKDFGVRFKIGPVMAMVDGGPAEQAGIQIGDVITAIDGQTDIDAYTMILDPPDASETIELTVRRADGVEAKVSVVAGEVPQANSPVSPLTDAIASDRLGLAYRPRPVVASTTMESELNVDDEIRELRFVFTDADAKASLEDHLSAASLETLTTRWELGPNRPLTGLMETVQVLPTGTKVMVKATRPPDGTIVEAELRIAQSDRYWYERGLNFLPMTSVHYADSVASAVALGYREGIKNLSRVAEFLGLLVRGRVNAKYVGGPIRIVQMAGMEAERGIAAQLLFLTMLSMNLAILNFLPIPALDGGHMVFLTAELIRGRRVDEALEMRLTLAGVLALLALMVFVFANDILNLTL